jgi:hypothetical protein
MARVMSISLDRDTYSVRDVVSKCLIMPSEIYQKHPNPLPDTVLNGTDKKHDLVKAYNREFDQLDKSSWNVFSILLPPHDVVEGMCLNRPIHCEPFETTSSDSETDDVHLGE